MGLGAGVNSTALLHVLIDRSYPLDEVIFADTGAEKSETYEYIAKWIEPYLQEKGIPYTEVRQIRRTLTERCISSHVIPDKRYRWSTRDFKIRPIEKHIRPKAPVHMYLGIAFDEIHRMKPSPRKYITNSWPLIDLKITREECERIIRAKGWPVPVKSGCWFCPFQSQKDWAWLLKNHPYQYEMAIFLEKNGQKYPNFLLREGGLEKLREKLVKMERRARDENILYGRQTTLLDIIVERREVVAAAEEECSGYCMT